MPGSIPLWHSSQDPSYPSVPPSNSFHEFVFHDGKMLVSDGMFTRLCQEGHIFRQLIFGGSGFRLEEYKIGDPIDKLAKYGITRKSFRALVFSLRNNDPKPAYKFRITFDGIGGFKTIDKYHRKRTRSTRKTISLLSENEDDPPGQSRDSSVLVS